MGMRRSVSFLDARNSIPLHQYQGAKDQLWGGCVGGKSGHQVFCVGINNYPLADFVLD